MHKLRKDVLKDEIVVNVFELKSTDKINEKYRH